MQLPRCNPEENFNLSATHLVHDKTQMPLFVSDMFIVFKSSLIMPTGKERQINIRLRLSLQRVPENVNEFRRNMNFLGFSVSTVNFFNGFVSEEMTQTSE